MDFHDFLTSIFHQFFDFFEKPKNHEIDDPYEVLACFPLPKPLIFRSIFHYFFMFFPEPLPEGIFGGSRCRSFLKSAVLVPFRVFGGARNPLRVRLRPRQSVLERVRVPVCTSPHLHRTHLGLHSLLGSLLRRLPAPREKGGPGDLPETPKP